MYKLGKYQFETFKYRPGHRANYAVLDKLGNNREWGIKYSPSYSYSREFDVLKKLSHPQIPKRYDCGKSDYIHKYIFLQQLYIILEFVSSFLYPIILLKKLSEIIHYAISNCR